VLVALAEMWKWQVSRRCNVAAIAEQTRKPEVRALPHIAPRAATSARHFTLQSPLRGIQPSDSVRVPKKRQLRHSASRL